MRSSQRNITKTTILRLSYFNNTQYIASDRHSTNELLKWNENIVHERNYPQNVDISHALQNRGQPRITSADPVIREPKMGTHQMASAEFVENKTAHSRQKWARIYRCLYPTARRTASKQKSKTLPFRDAHRNHKQQESTEDIVSIAHYGLGVS